MNEFINVNRDGVMIFVCYSLLICVAYLANKLIVLTSRVRKLEDKVNDIRYQ